MVDEEGTKRCSRCKEIKPLSAFHRTVSSEDGHHSECKKCASFAAGRKYREPIELPDGFRKCGKCGAVHPATEVWFKKEKRNKKDGLSNLCKMCASAYTRRWYRKVIETDPGYNAQRYANHREYHLSRIRLWYRNNKAHHRAKSREWYEKNYEYARGMDRKRYQITRTEFIEKTRQWRKDNQQRYRQYN
jgi:hypothetical protein